MMTFRQFMQSNPKYHPVMHEEMANVYHKQHEAFIDWVDHYVSEVIRELKKEIERNTTSHSS